MDLELTALVRMLRTNISLSMTFRVAARYWPA
jgi:hypothetical protein